MHRAPLLKVGIRGRQDELGDFTVNRDPADPSGAVLREPDLAVGAVDDTDRLGASRWLAWPSVAPKTDERNRVQGLWQSDKGVPGKPGC